MWADGFDVLIEEPEWHLVVKVPDQTELSNPNEQPVIPESRLRVCPAYMPWTVGAQKAVLPNASKCKSAILFAVAKKPHVLMYLQPGHCSSHDRNDGQTCSIVLQTDECLDSFYVIAVH